MTEIQQSPPVPLVRNEPVEVAAGVWVIPDGGVPLVPNVGFVDGKRSHLVVDTRSQLDELHEKAYPYADLFRTFGETVAEELEGFEMVEPDLVYDGEADIDLGGRIVQLRTYGGTHTKGDSWVFLPEERILFTGDLVENKGFAIFPYFPPDDVDVNGDR